MKEHINFSQFVNTFNAYSIFHGLTKFCQTFQKGPAIVAIMVSLQTHGAEPTILLPEE